MLSSRRKVAWFALSSRLFVIGLSAVANALLSDHSAHVFSSPAEPDAPPPSSLDVLVEWALGGLSRWDAQYFLHVAHYGYTYENCLAFFPLFPVAMRYAAHWLPLPLAAHARLLLAGTALNVLLFVKAADALYALTLRVLKSESLAYKAAVLFCVNPASVFFSALYSESLFAWLSFSAMLQCARPETLRFTNVNIASSAPVALSALTRSNGLLNLGFVAYACFKSVAENALPEIARRYRTMGRRALVPLLSFPLLASAMALALTCALSLLPFALVQLYNYYKFCVPHAHRLPPHLAQGEWVLPGQATSPWCNDTLPLAYSYVQRHYWNVGFLAYYRWRQIPNFLLAAPVVYLLARDLVAFFRQNRSHCRRLGIRTKGGRPPGAAERPPLYDPDMFVYAVHGCFLMAFAMLFAHVQIVTRLLCSASPLPYWFAALRIRSRPSKSAEQNHINEHFRKIGSSVRPSGDYFVVTDLEGVSNMHSRWKTFVLSKNVTDDGFKFIKLYFFGYLIVGTVCFSNYFPWT